jgi:hypothetical protein
MQADAAALMAAGGKRRNKEAKKVEINSLGDELKLQYCRMTL